MKLSSEAITNAFDLLRSRKLVIQCIADEERFNYICRLVKRYSDNIELIKRFMDKEIKSIDGLLITFNNIDMENIFEVEKGLMESRNKKNIILETDGIGESRDKRDLALTFINRYDISIIKGCRKDILYLINGQKYCKTSQADKYRDFSRKNNTVLIIKDEDYWITDGYSEFIIKGNNSLFDDLELNCILTGLLIGLTSLWDNKEQKIESILMAAGIFEVCKDMACERIKIDGYKEEYIKYFEEELLTIDSERINQHINISYKFKR